MYTNRGSVQIIIHPLSVKNIFERDLDLDKYSWVAYYCGRLGVELYRLGNFPEYYHFIPSINTSLRNRLIPVIIDYRGDKSGKRKALKRLRKRLYYLPKQVQSNLANPDFLFTLGNKFLDFGEYISRDKLDDRISNKHLTDLTSYISVPKKRFKFTPYNMMTHKLTIFLLCVLSIIVIYLISSYYLKFELYQSLSLAVISIPTIVIVLQILLGKLEKQ